MDEDEAAAIATYIILVRTKLYLEGIKIVT